MRATPRQQAFRQPAPTTWTPAVGERVYLPRDGGLGSLVSTGTVLLTVPPGWARVAITYGRHRLVRIYRTRDLRPLNPSPGPL